MSGITKMIEICGLIAIFRTIGTPNRSGIP